MMSWQKQLDRWQSAGLIDAAAAERICAYEAAQRAAPRLRWQAWVALALGAILLGAGMLLYVATQWDFLTPGWRLALIAAMPAVLHLGGGVTSRRFGALSMTLHGVGTVVLGGSIFAAAEVLHISFGPAAGAFLLWSAGAWLGVFLLRDWAQIGLAAFLTPAWLVAEYSDRHPYDYPAATSVFILLMATAYLAARRDRQDGAWRHVLTILGIAAVIPAAGVASNSPAKDIAGTPAWGWGLAFLIPMGVAYGLRRKDAWRQLVWVGWAAVVIAIQNADWDLGRYLWSAVGAVLLVEWGLRDSCAERVNLGVAAFALTVLNFYFSSVMSNVNRSVSLIVLGLLFLGGGWQLEKLRRRLIENMEKNPS